MKARRSSNAVANHPHPQDEGRKLLNPTWGRVPGSFVKFSQACYNMERMSTRLPSRRLPAQTCPHCGSVVAVRHNRWTPHFPPTLPHVREVPQMCEESGKDLKLKR